MWENGEIIIQIIKRNKPTKTIQVAMNGLSVHTSEVGQERAPTKAGWRKPLKFTRFNVTQGIRQKTLSSKQPCKLRSMCVMSSAEYDIRQNSQEWNSQDMDGSMLSFCQYWYQIWKPSFSRRVQTLTPSTVHQRHILMDIILITWSSYGQCLG